MIAIDALTATSPVGLADVPAWLDDDRVPRHDRGRPPWRGRGVAMALKHATIAWAIGRGLEALETGNDDDNRPMRAINIKLGYLPIPDCSPTAGRSPPAERPRHTSGVTFDLNGIRLRNRLVTSASLLGYGASKRRLILYGLSRSPSGCRSSGSAP